MPQPKGKTGNPNGRPKGQPNKITSTVRSWIVQLINDNREQLEQDFKNLEPEKRLAMLEKFLPYLMPKVASDWDVKGACYDTEDVQPAVSHGWADTDYTLGNVTPASVKRWYEKEDAAAV